MDIHYEWKGNSKEGFQHERNNYQEGRERTRYKHVRREMIKLILWGVTEEEKVWEDM